MTAQELALDLGMLQPDDVQVLLSQMVDLHDDEIPAVWCAEVRDVVNRHGERSVPELYWPGAGETTP
jgi:hypothetical protein